MDTLKLDYFPRPLGDLLRACETHCIADCCQKDAFDFGMENIERWVSSVPMTKACRALRQLHWFSRRVSAHKGPVYSPTIRHTWRAGHVMGRWLDELKCGLNRAGVSPWLDATTVHPASRSELKLWLREINAGRIIVCPECRALVKAENLLRHMDQHHPHHFG